MVLVGKWISPTFRCAMFRYLLEWDMHHACIISRITTRVLPIKKFRLRFSFSLFDVFIHKYLCVVCRYLSNLRQYKPTELKLKKLHNFLFSFWGRYHYSNIQSAFKVYNKYIYLTIDKVWGHFVKHTTLGSKNRYYLLLKKLVGTLKFHLNFFLLLFKHCFKGQCCWRIILRCDGCFLGKP